MNAALPDDVFTQPTSRLLACRPVSDPRARQRRRLEVGASGGRGSQAAASMASPPMPATRWFSMPRLPTGYPAAPGTDDVLIRACHDDGRRAASQAAPPAARLHRRPLPLSLEVVTRAAPKTGKPRCSTVAARLSHASRRPPGPAMRSLRQPDDDHALRHRRLAGGCGASHLAGWSRRGQWRSTRNCCAACNARHPGKGDRMLIDDLARVELGFKALRGTARRAEARRPR